MGPYLQRDFYQVAPLTGQPFHYVYHSIELSGPGLLFTNPRISGAAGRLSARQTEYAYLFIRRS